MWLLKIFYVQNIISSKVSREKNRLKLKLHDFLWRVESRGRLGRKNPENNSKLKSSNWKLESNLDSGSFNHFKWNEMMKYVQMLSNT